MVQVDSGRIDTSSLLAHAFSRLFPADRKWRTVRDNKFMAARTIYYEQLIRTRSDRANQGTRRLQLGAPPGPASGSAARIAATSASSAPHARVISPLRSTSALHSASSVPSSRPAALCKETKRMSQDQLRGLHRHPMQVRPYSHLPHTSPSIMVCQHGNNARRCCCFQPRSSASTACLVSKCGGTRVDCSVRPFPARSPT